ncbi:AprI/Inh family metalloprotease inhibitor [Pseudomonas sp. CFSAN084952]|uniref:AprI/Inh family metalloprotease inhibitor n=1 Tax=Pseudomonas TaxID=286 RepID=UPI001299FDE9|nr:AprI/Inh family metalloprotease inhibitor [Pseudomonas sp. CFSAN084952]QGF91730.1 AprI/Inh family metalloprotease inhibitor [Pseudomonas sp. CFSAN084952]
MPRFSYLIACVVQVGVVSAGARAMASSLVLPTSAQLAGQWELKNRDQVCSLKLVEQANVLEGDIACVEQWLGDKPLTWSSTPDGIWLFNAEGAGIIHMNRQKEGDYQARTKAGKAVRMQRKPS